MSKKVIVTNSKGEERTMYLQETGSCVSTVSTHPRGNWKTDENVFNSSIKDAETGEPMEKTIDEILKDIE